MEPQLVWGAITPTNSYETRYVQLKVNVLVHLVEKLHGAGAMATVEPPNQRPEKTMVKSCRMAQFRLLVVYMYYYVIKGRF